MRYTNKDMQKARSAWLKAEDDLEKTDLENVAARRKARQRVDKAFSKCVEISNYLGVPL